MNKIQDLAEDVMINLFNVITWGVVPKHKNEDEDAFMGTLTSMVGEQIWYLLKEGRCSLLEAVQVSELLGNYLAQLGANSSMKFQEVEEG